MGRRLRTTASTEYSLFTGAEQHGNARSAGFSKSCLSDFLESSRNRTTVSGKETGNGENTRENSNLPTAVRSGKGNFQIQRANKTEK